MVLNNAKGVSPLIATVILVLISVALGATIITFFQRTTMELTDSTDERISRGIKCSLDLSIRVLEINNNKYICYNRSGTDNFEVIIENQGTTELAGVQLFMFDATQNPFTYNVIKKLGSHNRTRYNITVNGFVFPPTQVLISPILSATTNSVDVCFENQLEIEDVERCV